MKTIIASNPTEKVQNFDKKQPHLNIAECFTSIQGEGVTTGVPSVFLRLQGCTLKCVWCDSIEVWEEGNPYTFPQVFELFEEMGVIEDLRGGHHLILTGGSPLKQQNQLIKFLEEFQLKYDFLPYIEIENEAVLIPKPEMFFLVNQWNNSPKLENSGMKERARYKPEILRELSEYPNSWFKFVIAEESDWDELKKDFLDTELIRSSQVILMPEGSTDEELDKKKQFVIDLCMKHNLIFSSRLQVDIWNQSVGV